MAELRAILAARAAALPPCPVCGDQDRSPSGGCRPCASERKRLQRERERSPEVLERSRLLLEIGQSYAKRSGIELPDLTLEEVAAERAKVAEIRKRRGW